MRTSRSKTVCLLTPLTALAFMPFAPVPAYALGQQQAGTKPATETELGTEDTASDIAIERDKVARMTVPISIGDRGPYRFLIDTGAERTVIADDLAKTLGLGAGRSVEMHSMSGVSRVDTVVIPKLKVSTKTVKDINAPALSRKNLGAEGMLGVDSLQSQNVLFDFKKMTMTVSPARKTEERWDGDAIVIRARSLYGRLILADAKADGQKVWVIIDTGSQASIGNEALRSKLIKHKKLAQTIPIELVSVTGGIVKADYTKISGLVLGGVTLTDMPIAFADVHPFKKLGLLDRPALLLGMNALRVFERVSVDFANRKVRFLLPNQSNLEEDKRLAMAQ